MRYSLWHRTTYTYDEAVTDSLGIGHLVPRELPWQRVHAADLTIEPVPSDASSDVDCYGNTVSWFQVTEPHTSLFVEATSEIEVSDTAYDPVVLARPWEDCRPLEGSSGFDWESVDFALPSPMVGHPPKAREYAAASLTPGRPVGEAVTDLMHRIHADFVYDPVATTVSSTVADTLAKRAGVCQDFAHLTLSCLRVHGLAARYVSGYLATEPAPGQDRVVGADASHAWVAVAVPGAAGEPPQWLALDPTNDQWAGDRYITVAWGRDYGDVPPLKGVIFTEATTSTMDVSVDVSRVG